VVNTNGDATPDPRISDYDRCVEACTRLDKVESMVDFGDRVDDLRSFCIQVLRSVVGEQELVFQGKKAASRRNPFPRQRLLLDGSIFLSGISILQRTASGRSSYVVFAPTAYGSARSISSRP
jgi:hypothetical protein